jgi:hypothetical protein
MNIFSGCWIKKTQNKNKNINDYKCLMCNENITGIKSSFIYVYDCVDKLDITKNICDDCVNNCDTCKCCKSEFQNESTGQIYVYYTGSFDKYACVCKLCHETGNSIVDILQRIN